uniref:Protein hunchback (Fragments) n=1 Tax=Drosophila mimica TaxID=7270 RepID=HUNB_DROMM|nr:RecName: Full=Protein hunchback [Drosophila mimica]
WYSSMFAANIKQEPISHHNHHHHHHHGHHQHQQRHNSNSNASSPHQSPLPNLQLEQYLKQQQQQPLMPPGLPNPMQTIMPANMRPSPTARTTTTTAAAAPTTTAAAIAMQANDKLQALTPPMDVTPPKSPAKTQQSCAEPEKEHDLMSNSSEDMKYMA